MFMAKSVTCSGQTISSNNNNHNNPPLQATPAAVETSDDENLPR